MANGRRVSWNEWPKIRDLLGLRVLEVRMEEGADTTIVVDGPRESLAMIADNIFQPANEKKLASMLADLFTYIYKNPGNPKRVELPGGLRIDGIHGLDDVVRIQLSREKVYPSMKEWETIIKHLPIGAGIFGNPEKFIDKGFNYLRSARLS